VTLTVRLFGRELLAIQMYADDPVTLFESEEDE
jgi:hypothetical protein